MGHDLALCNKCGEYYFYDYECDCSRPKRINVLDALNIKTGDKLELANGIIIDVKDFSWCSRTLEINRTESKIASNGFYLPEGYLLKDKEYKVIKINGILIEYNQKSNWSFNK